MNEQNCTTIIRDDGFRLWGNRMLGGVGSYNFLSVRRTADIIAEAILAAHRRFVDRPITPGFLEDVLESVQLFMDQLKAREAIADGRVWYDPDLNNAADIANGHVTFSYEIGPFTPAERITFRASINTKLTADVLAASVAN
jgi:phage tail sheath protein FI